MDEHYNIIKYPRTPHLQGSRLQPGDEDLAQIPFSEIAGLNIVVEEKIDGANTAVSFDADGGLLLQSRGHYLVGGYREKHYDLFKQWAQAHAAEFHSVLGGRYIMYGEWLYAKHSIYYDALPHYFMEFDIYDRQDGIFLDTDARQALLKPLPVCSARVITRGSFSKLDEVLKYLGDSAYITEAHIDNLRLAAERANQDPDAICRQTDMTRTMEGLYIKVERDGQVTRRLKYVRRTFLQVVEESQTHWLERAIVPNGLNRPVAELFQ